MSTILDAEVIDSDTDTEDANGDEQTSLPNIDVIWQDEFIEKMDSNKWRCVWCKQTFKGTNATKALMHVNGAKDFSASIKVKQIV